MQKEKKLAVVSSTKETNMSKAQVFECPYGISPETCPSYGSCQICRKDLKKDRPLLHSTK